LDAARARHRLITVYPAGISKIESGIDSVEIEVTRHSVALGAALSISIAAASPQYNPHLKLKESDQHPLARTS
jgi:hypothetical protein